MKPLLRYHQTKFASLSPARQLKSLDKLLFALVGSLADPARYQLLRAEVQNCLGWMKPLADPQLRTLKGLLASPAGPHQIIAAIDAWRASRGQTFSDGQLELIRGDAPREADPSRLARAAGITVILDNLRSVFNVGSIFRSAECLGIPTLYLCGVSATPEHPALAKTARGTAERVGWKHFPSAADAIAQAKADGCLICAVETAAAASSVFETNLPTPLALVLGNESLGLAPETMALCGCCVRLPVQGWKNSLNVATAFAVCAYQIVFGHGLREVQDA